MRMIESETTKKQTKEYDNQGEEYEEGDYEVYDNEDVQSHIVLLAHLSSDRFELGQLPNARFTLGWNTTYIDAIGNSNVAEIKDKPITTSLYAYKIQAEVVEDKRDSVTAAGKRNSITAKRDESFATELRLACKKIRIATPMNLKEGIKEMDLLNCVKARDPSIFAMAVYNQSKFSWLKQVADKEFFLGLNTRAHRLFVLCCKRVLGKLPEYKHIEIVTERAAVSTMSGNDGEPFEETILQARNIFKNDTVCSLFAAILRNGGLESFLQAAGGEKAFDEKNDLDENDPLIKLCLVACILVKESNTNLHQVGISPKGFTPRTPFFFDIVNRIQFHLNLEKFEIGKVSKRDRSLHEVLDLFSKNKVLFHLIVEDMIRLTCNIRAGNELEFYIARKFALEVLLESETAKKTKDSVNEDDAVEGQDNNMEQLGIDNIYKLFQKFLKGDDFANGCKTAMLHIRPLLEFPDMKMKILETIENVRGYEKILEGVYDAINNFITNGFLSEDINEVSKALKSVRVLLSVAKANKDAKVYVSNMIHSDGSIILLAICMYAAYSSAIKSINEHAFSLFHDIFKSKIGMDDTSLEVFQMSLGNIFDDDATVWRAIEGIALTLLEFNASFTLLNGYGKQLLRMIHLSSWSGIGLLPGNREFFLLKLLFENTKSTDKKKELINYIDDILKEEGNQFISPYLRGDTDRIKENLEDSLYWITFASVEPSLCSYEDNLRDATDFPVSQIKLAAIKDKLVMMIANHLNEQKSIDDFLKFSCKNCACQKITMHQRIIRHHFFDENESEKHLRNFVGYLRSEVANNLFKKPFAWLNEFGLAKIRSVLDINQIQQVDYQDLLSLPFTKGRGEAPESQMEAEEYSTLITTIETCLKENHATRLYENVNGVNNISEIYRYRAYFVVLVYEYGLKRRRDVSKWMMTDSICIKLQINAEERKWMQTLGGNPSEFPINVLPNIREDDLPASFSDSHKQLKALSIPLYFLACEPESPVASFYLALLATAFGAPRERNHVWQRIFNIQQTKRNIGAPFFPPHRDVDCSYDLGGAAADLMTQVDDRYLHKCHIGAVAWGCNALACALMTSRSQNNMLESIRGICNLPRDQKTSEGMDAELVRVAGTNELAWRNQYLHIRFVNFLGLLQRQMEAPNIHPSMKVWPKDLTGAFSICVLDRYRQLMCIQPAFQGSFPQNNDMQRYEGMMTQILVEVENASSRLVASVQEKGNARNAANWLVNAQEFIVKIQLEDPSRNDCQRIINQYFHTKINGNKIGNRDVGHLLDYISRYRNAADSVKVMKEHGVALYDIYRFCCTHLSGKLYYGDAANSGYSDSTMLYDVLLRFAKDEGDKGNEDIASKAKYYANQLIIHYNELSRMVNMNAAIGCQQTQRPTGEMLLAGDALGGVPDSENKAGWIVKLLVDIGDPRSKIIEMMTEDLNILRSWDSQNIVFGAISDEVQRSGVNLIDSLLLREIDDFDGYLNSHFPKKVDEFKVNELIDTLANINQKIVEALGAGIYQSIKWKESDLILDIEWKKKNKEDDDYEDDEGEFNEEQARRDRLDMLDNDGVKLAKLTGFDKLSDGEYPEYILKLTLNEKQIKEVRRFLESKGVNGRVNAYIFCPRFVEACGICTSENINDNLHEFVNDWQDKTMRVKNLWHIGRICIEIMLSRNSKFSDLDVVLQSGFVYDGGKLRRKLLLNITKKDAIQLLQQIKELSIYLHDRRVVVMLAEDPQQEVRKALKEIFPTYEPEVKILSNNITGSCLADYLLLLYDIASRLRLRCAKFGTISPSSLDDENDGGAKIEGENVGESYSDQPLDVGDEEYKDISIERFLRTDNADQVLQDVPNEFDQQEQNADDEKNESDALSILSRIKDFVLGSLIPAHSDDASVLQPF